MNPIGGYFELELPHCHNMPNWHIAKVNSGRNALEYILRVIGPENISMLYVPRFTCEVVIEPMHKLGIHQFKFYDVDDKLEVKNMPKLQDDDYIIINNYFGIKDLYINQLIGRIPKHIIVDNSQALFYPAKIGIKSFYSPRKFVGVPDGGLANVPGEIESLEQDESYDRCSHLLERIDLGANKGFDDFKANSKKLKNLPLRKLSALTGKLLQGIDFHLVQGQRKHNYDILRTALQDSNLLETPNSNEICCPMVYPYRIKDKDLRQKLIDNKIFVATYWPNVFEWCKPEDLEYKLTKEIIPLPIDQRYGEEEMEEIINIISDYNK